MVKVVVYEAYYVADLVLTSSFEEKLKLAVEENFAV